MESVSRWFSSLSISSAVRYRDLGTKPPSGTSHLGKTPNVHDCFLSGEIDLVLCSVRSPRPPTHHALPSQEVRDDFSIHVVHQSSWALVVISSKYQELLARVLVNQWADLHPDIRQHNCSSRLFFKVEQPLVSFCWPLVSMERGNLSAGSLRHSNLPIPLKSHIHIAE